MADIDVIDAEKRFGGNHVIRKLNLRIKSGEFVVLLGPSGCGKTTTLRMIGGFEEPTEGTIYLGDRTVTGQPPHKRDVNTVFQSYALFPHLTIFENVAFGLRRSKVKGSEVRTRTEEMLQVVGLKGYGNRKPRQLSGGQQQRVALGRALVNRPRVLLLDEPLGALDLKLRKEMQFELKRIQHDMGITFVHVTHDQEEAMTMADSIVVMNDGHIEQMGEPAELYERPATAFVANFLGVSNLLPGTVEGADAVRLDSGSVLHVTADAIGGRRGAVSVGIRPEKLRIADGGTNTLSGEIVDRAYVGVSTQYVVRTPMGDVSVYVQGAGSQAPGERMDLSFEPDATFVVSRSEDEEA